VQSWSYNSRFCVVLDIIGGVEGDGRVYIFERGLLQ